MQTMWKSLASLGVLGLLAACSSSETPPAAQPDAGAVTDAGNTSDAQPVPEAGTDAGSCYAGEAYDGAGFATNAAAELRLRTQYATFTQLMKDVEAGTKTATAAEMRALFDAGAPSLRSITAPAIASLIDAVLTEYEAVAGLSYTPSEPPPATGGKYGAYLYSKDGVDLRQQVEKTMYGASFYRAAADIMAKTVTEADIDRLVALFGAHPSFPGSDSDPTNPDKLAATYAERRDRKDAAKPGIYLRFKDAATRAQVAVRRGASCASALQSALGDMRQAWEQSIFATNIFYLNDAGTKLDAADTSKWSAALHAYGEVLAFTEGFRHVPQAYRKVTDAQIDSMLTTLRMPPGGTPKAYTFALGTGDSAATFTRVISATVTVYGFTADDVETFKTNF
jgi:type II secretory pathway pseudopilin PulG